MSKFIAAALAALMVGLAACGGSTTTEDSTKSDTTTEATTTKAKAKPKPKPQSKRAKLKACLEGVGYSVESPDPKMLRVKQGDGRPAAVVLLYKSTSAAERSAADGDAEGLSTASFGRAEVNYFNRAADPQSAESRVVSECVSDQYGS
jgi:hypothetical protein